MAESMNFAHDIIRKVNLLRGPKYLFLLFLPNIFEWFETYWNGHSHFCRDCGCVCCAEHSRIPAIDRDDQVRPLLVWKWTRNLNYVIYLVEMRKLCIKGRQHVTSVTSPCSVTVDVYGTPPLEMNDVRQMIRIDLKTKYSESRPVFAFAFTVFVNVWPSNCLRFLQLAFTFFVVMLEQH